MYYLIREFYRKRFISEGVDEENLKSFMDYLKDEEKCHRNWPDIKFYLALGYFWLGDQHQGEKKLAAALKINPDYIKALEVDAFLNEREKRNTGIKQLNRLLKREKLVGENRSNLVFLKNLFIVIFNHDKRKFIRNDDFNNKILLELFSTEPNTVKLNRYLGSFKKLIKEKSKFKISNKDIVPLQEFIIDYYSKKVIFNQFFNRLSSFCLENLNFECAGNALNLSILMIPDYSGYFLGRARINYSRGKINPAKKQISRALKFDKQYSKIYSILAEINGYQGDYQQAEKNLRKAIKLNPKYPDLHFNLGLLYSDINRLQLAVKYLKNALEINPNYHLAVMNMGEVYYRMNNFKESVKIFEDCLVKGLKFPEVYYYLGCSCLETGLEKKGVSYLEQALKLDPGYPYPYVELMKHFKKKSLEYRKHLIDLGYEDLVPEESKNSKKR